MGVKDFGVGRVRVVVEVVVEELVTVSTVIVTVDGGRVVVEVSMEVEVK